MYAKILTISILIITLITLGIFSTKTSNKNKEPQIITTPILNPENIKRFNIDKMPQLPIITSDKSTTTKITTTIEINKNNLKFSPKFINSLNMDFVFVSIKEEGFYIQRTEVTQGQWLKVMGYNPSRFKECGDNCPVELVSWNDIQAFIKQVNMLEKTDKYRMPTEAEWEFVCNNQFPEEILKNLNSYAWYLENSAYKTHPVAKKKPNKVGVYDIWGNVKEWCQIRDGGYSFGDIVETKQPIRGSSCFNNLKETNCNYRVLSSIDFKDSSLGFRLVKML
ncbi:MAG: formylglycine-generating enzyme family protein [Desulfobacterales bacterium]|nr:formylglycine-generating enzyme family protein [Desulfobacterales bacterium]MBF0396328.1 formylglycine-generating enzyme family protein [Desulfobacterales bacterium]